MLRWTAQQSRQLRKRVMLIFKHASELEGFDRRQSRQALAQTTLRPIQVLKLTTIVCIGL